MDDYSKLVEDSGHGVYVVHLGYAEAGDQGAAITHWRKGASDVPVLPDSSRPAVEAAVPGEATAF